MTISPPGRIAKASRDIREPLLFLEYGIRNWRGYGVPMKHHRNHRRVYLGAARGFVTQPPVGLKVLAYLLSSASTRREVREICKTDW